MKDSKKDIYIYINIIKIIACLLVIINHTINHVLLFETKGVSFFFCLLFSFCKVAVPLFIICSGFLILEKQYSYKKIFKNIIKVLVPLIIISGLLYVKDTGIKNINILTFISKFLAEPYIKPYWYLYMLLGLYLITPFIQKMVKQFEKKDYYYFIIFFLFIPAILKLLLVCFGIKYSSYWLISFVPYTIGYYVFGSYLKHDYNDININITRIIFVVSFLGMFLLSYLPSLYGNGISYKFDDVSSLPVIIMSLSLIYLLYNRFKNIKYNNKLNSFINTISSTTFGIYLFHHLIGYRIFTSGLVQILCNFNIFIGYLISVIGIFVVCGIITYILKHIPVVRDFL